jgi:hypothetical protein
MSRAIPVWLLASTLCAFVGCGGGEATDSSPVAENSGGATPANDAGAAMPSSGGAGAAASTPGEAGMEAGMENMTAGMNSGMPGSSDPAAIDPAMEGMMAGMEGPTGGDSSGGTDPAMPDPAMMEAYAAGLDSAAAGADAGAADTASMELAAAGAGAEGYDIAGGSAGGLGGAVEEKIPDTLDGKAQLAFRRGKEKDALQFLYAHALTSDEGAENLLSTIRWVGGLRQPALAVRWGVGFVVTAPRNFNGDPKPVGSHQTLPTRGGPRDGGGGNEGYVGGGGETDYGGGDGGGGKNSLLAKGAGELGEKLLAAYTERLMRGDFGEVLKNAADGRNQGNRGNRGAAGMEGYGGESGGAGASPGGGGDAAGAAAATQVTQITAGLSMLGIGTQKELIDRAREDGIDAVVIIDVKLRVSPSNNLVTNESTIALLDAKTQKKLHTTKKFNNITIQQARADEKDDGVDKEFESLFEAVDANLKMADLPAGLNADIAAKRIDSLAAEKHDNPLPILVEAKMYHSKGLLDEAQLFAAYEKLLGVDSGRMLATGTEEDKVKALSAWIPEL